MNRNQDERNYNYEDSECIVNYNNNYVDVFGRLILTVQDVYTKEIFVSLNELKKSGFELFQAGTLPTVGDLPQLTESQLQYFEMYMKMKATKFVINLKKHLPPEVDQIISKEKQRFSFSSPRTVKASEGGSRMDLKITAQVDSSPKSIEKNYSENHQGREKANFNSSDNKYRQQQRRQTNYCTSESFSGASKNNNNRNANYNPEQQRRNHNTDRKFQQPTSFGEHEDASCKNMSNTFSNETKSRESQDRRTFLQASINQNSPHSGGQENHYQKYNKNNDAENIKQQSNFKFNNRRNLNNLENKNKQTSNLRQPNVNMSNQTITSPLAENKYNETSNLYQPNESKQTITSPSAKTMSGSIESHSSVQDNKPKNVINNTNLQEISSKIAVKYSPKLKQNELINKLESEENGSLNLVKSSESVSLTKATELKDNPLNISQVKNCRKNIIEEVCNSGIFECTEVLNENTIIGFALPDSKAALDNLSLLEEMTNDCEIDPNFSPLVGTTIAILKDDAYVRGVITKKNDKKFTCALIDYGVFHTSETICPLPKKYVDIPEFACTCIADTAVLEDIISSGKDTLLTIETPKVLTVTTKNPTKVHKLLGDSWNFSAESTTETICLKTPVFNTASPKNLLKQNDLVIIVSYFKGKLLLRTRECCQLLKEIEVEIKEYKGSSIQHLELNQLVICSCRKVNNIHRAKVLSINIDDITVKHVDYGDVHVISIKDLQTISEKLAEYSNTLISIDLYKFSDKELSPKALEFLSNSITKKEKFSADYKGHDNVYDLITRVDGNSLSEMLLLHSKPASSVGVLETVAHTIKRTASPEIFKLGDLKPCLFNKGLNDVLCSYNGELKDGFVTFCSATKEMYHLMDSMTLKIEKQVKSDNSPYSPIIHEVVLADFEGTWYRALIVEVNGDQYDVYYFDFGNSGTVTSKSIRKITKDIFDYICLSAICKLEGLLDGDSIKEPLLSRLKVELTENENYQIDVLERVDDAYNITIPSVYSKLSKEGLISL